MDAAVELDTPVRRRKAVRNRPRALKAYSPTEHPLLCGAPLKAPELPGWLPPWCLPENLIFSARLSMPTPSNNEVRKMHFATYQKVRHRMRMELKRYLARPEDDGDDSSATVSLEQAALLVVRVSDKLLDWDNAYGGLKPLQDCLVPRDVKRAPSGLGLIADDNPNVLPHPPYILQRKSDAGCDGYTDLFLFSLPLELAPVITGDQLALPSGSCDARKH